MHMIIFHIPKKTWQSFHGASKYHPPPYSRYFMTAALHTMKPRNQEHSLLQARMGPLLMYGALSAFN